MAWVKHICIILFLSAGFLPVQAQLAEFAEAGVLNAREWNFEQSSLPLRGYWMLYDDVLLHPSEIHSHSASEHFFPAVWNDYRKDNEGTGVATYSLQVLLPDTITRLSLDIPQLFSSFRLWANGKEVASAGKVATTKEEATPAWIYRIAPIHVPAGDTLELVLQIANFHHHKGGMRDPISLGTQQTTKNKLDRAISINVIEAELLFSFGVFFAGYFFIVRKYVVLYFALLSVTWAVRCLFSNLYPVTIFYPELNWNIQVRAEYLSLYFGVLWATLFLHSLLRKFSNRILTYTVVAVNVLFVIYTIFTPVQMFSQWIGLYLGVAAVVVIYAAVLIVRASLTDYAGSWFLIASLLTGVVIFGYDILAYNTLFAYNHVFLSTGYVIIFLLTTVALLLHLEVLKSRNAKIDVLTYDEMMLRK